MVTKLHGVHPRLVQAYHQLSAALAELGHPIIVTDGLRTADQQAQLYAQGRTLPGRIVTHADGILRRSNHQAKADGFGHAIDCAFLVENRPSWAERHPWQLYGEAAKALGLVWGGSWPRFPDRPHIELPESLLDGPSVGADVPGGGAQ